MNTGFLAVACRRVVLPVCFLAFAAVLTTARGQTTLFNITLDSGTIPSGLVSQNTSNTTVVANSTLDPSGTGNYVLQLASGNMSAFAFSAAALQGTTNTLTLTLSFAYTTAATTNDLNIGLMNNNGTAAANANISGSGAALDDFGLWNEVRYSSGFLQTQSVAESGGDTGIFFGTDRNYLSSATTTTSTPSGDTNAHTLTLVMNYNSSGYYTVGETLDAANITSNTNSSSGTLTTFNASSFNPNELVIFAKSGGVQLNNIMLTTSAVPEPNTTALLVGAAGMLVWWMRRARSRKA